MLRAIGFAARRSDGFLYLDALGDERRRLGPQPVQPNLLQEDPPRLPLV